MVRLSEALARVHCSKTITPEYVKEAARLLSNSILRVERPDLEIQPFDENMDLNANLRPSDTNIFVTLYLFTLYTKGIFSAYNRKKN